MMAVRRVSFDAIDSTNAEAMRRAAAGERGPLWIVAARQSAGRGRQGREWESGPGNLYATLLLTSPVPADVAAQTSFVAALAVFDLAAGVLGEPKPIEPEPHPQPLPPKGRGATERLSAPSPLGGEGRGGGRRLADDPSRFHPVLALKWPNDVLLDGAKLSGILIETVAHDAPGHTTVAIGMGVNLRHAPERTRYGATSLARHEGRIAPDEAFARLAAAMAARLADWNDGRGFAVIRRDWTARAAGLGRRASVTMGERTVIGDFTGLASDGALLLSEPGGQLHVIHAGEVSLALEAP
jgi:BirA family biotin operon repressor/biotin-[acetyl-CoA-carboxylase] ligase